ncbi:uncharacterized protein LOC124371080, partial [Homalodisca vitripennis]|uniref:uncharacterized protein LOC124371080 n=1 Tax=Homalodisca vitripennis TaxID=197043 RepID=UPI001EEC3905
EKNEDVVSIVKEVGKVLDFNISNTMIDACHRLGKRSEPNSPPPGIVLKFISRLDKEELLRKRRVKSKFSTRHMNLEMDKPVYINESLTPMKRKLMAEARKFKRENNYQFVWVRDGRIFLRKEEASKVIHVTCQADLPKRSVTIDVTTIHAGITDHSLVCIALGGVAEGETRPPPPPNRDGQRINYVKLKQLLDAEDWSCVYNKLDPVVSF